MLFLHGAMLAVPVTLLIAHTRFRLGALGFCVFKTCFGIDCPACGITRSVMATFSGQMSEAFRLHPAGPVVIGIVAIMALYLALVLLTGHKGLAWRKEAKAYNVLEAFAIAALVIGWVGKSFIN
ncbi:MAG: DUF2752 domain-containing protein [Thermoguttaceae bacterium]